MKTTDYTKLIEQLRLKMRANYKRPLPDDEDAAAAELSARMIREMQLTPEEKIKLKVRLFEVVAAQS